MVEIKQQTAHTGNFGGSRSADTIRYIVIHYTGNDGDTAKNNADYYASNIVKTSAHYFVDAKEIIQSVPELRIAWAVGGKKYASCAETGGGRLYGECVNANSLSIELCDVVRDGKLEPNADTVERALSLTRHLMAKYGISRENVIRHFDVTGKLCPAYWAGQENEARWRTEFWDRLCEDTEKKEATNMDKETFKALWGELRKELQSSDGSEWSKDAREWAVSSGLIVGGTDGYMWQDMMTREQLVTVLYRFARAMGLT